MNKEISAMLWGGAENVEQGTLDQIIHHIAAEANGSGVTQEQTGNIDVAIKKVLGCKSEPIKEYLLFKSFMGSILAFGGTMELVSEKLAETRRSAIERLDKHQSQVTLPN